MVIIGIVSVLDSHHNIDTQGSNKYQTKKPILFLNETVHIMLLVLSVTSAKKHSCYKLPKGN